MTDDAFIPIDRNSTPLCDCCKQKLSSVNIENYISINHTCTASSPWPEGTVIQAMLCESCVHSLLGPVLRDFRPGTARGIASTQQQASHVACSDAESRDLTIESRENSSRSEE